MSEKDFERNGSGQVIESEERPAEKNRLRYMALAVLMIQSSVFIITLRYSRMGEDSALYIKSTAVLLNEIIKISVCTLKSTYDYGFTGTFKCVFGRDHWKLAFPAALYVLQNNLQYVAASNLDAGTFQVSYQLKILTTAFFSVALLHRRLSWQQWCSLLLLTIGVAFTQVPGNFWTHALNMNDEVSPEPEVDKLLAHKQVIGFGAVIISCTLSGLAGVYFEKVLKHSENVSLWVRNIQLGMYSLIPALVVGVLGVDGAEIREKGFFYGYSTATWSAIFLQAAGGIIVAIVVKYTDNIMKNFATSMSIVVSTVASLVLWGTTITSTFLIGSSMVILSTFWFSNAER